MAEPEIITMPQFGLQMLERRATEKVGYYRLKSGWITGSDTQPSKLVVMLAKGATYLPQFGQITDSRDYWGPILRHPDGPAQFPVDQILAYRWYRPEFCPVKGISFPQLAGEKITEYPCPENCARMPFHSPLHLASHMRLSHDYERHEIIAYGQASGIDFSKIPGGREVIEYITPSVPDETTPPAAFAVDTVSPANPMTETTADTGAKFVCECGWDKGRSQQALDMHQRRWCKLTEKPIAAKAEGVFEVTA